jgi:hypothetical protein
MVIVRQLKRGGVMLFDWSYGESLVKTFRSARALKIIATMLGVALLILLCTIPGPFHQEKLNYHAEFYYGIDDY